MASSSSAAGGSGGVDDKKSLVSEKTVKDTEKEGSTEKTEKDGAEKTEKETFKRKFESPEETREDFAPLTPVTCTNIYFMSEFE